MIGLAVHMTSLFRRHGRGGAGPVGWIETHDGGFIVYVHDCGCADV
jgi:predicted sugar kinase